MTELRWMVRLAVLTIALFWTEPLAAGQQQRDPTQTPGIPHPNHSTLLLRTVANMAPSRDTTGGRDLAYQTQKPAIAPSNPKFPEPMIKVEPVYPEKALKAGAGTVIAEVSINALGEVTNARILKFAPDFEETALAALRLWRYFPIFQDGEAKPQVVIAHLVFDPRARRYAGRVGVQITTKGDLRDFDGLPISFEKLKASNWIIVTCEPWTSFPVLEKTLRSMQDQGISFHLSSWTYAFEAGRLFYRVLSGTAMSSDADGDVQPPKLDFVVDHLAALAKASGPSAYLPPSVIGGGLLVPVTYLSYVVYVSERGETAEVQRTGGPDVPEVENALKQARVLLPGQRKGEPVPATVSVLIPIK
jgi:TonB family protein